MRQAGPGQGDCSPKHWHIAQVHHRVGPAGVVPVDKGPVVPAHDEHVRDLRVLVQELRYRGPERRLEDREEVKLVATFPAWTWSVSEGGLEPPRACAH